MSGESCASWDAAENLYGPLLRESERQSEESENSRKMREPTELERTIGQAITDFEEKHRRVDYMVVTNETFRELARLGRVVDLLNKFLVGEGVKYTSYLNVKIILPEHVEAIGGERAVEEYLTFHGGEPLVLAKSGWFKKLKHMSFYDLDSYH